MAEIKVDTVKSAPKALDRKNPDVRAALEANDAAEALLPEADHETQFFATSTEGSFQIVPDRWARYGDGTPYIVDGKTLNWPNDHRPIPVDDETAEQIQQILAGTFKNGSVPPNVLREVALACNLQLIRPGIAAAPIDTWDSLADDKVVAIAKGAGFLKDEHAVRSAIRAEGQRSIRTEGRHEPRPRVLNELRRELEDLVGALDRKDPAAGITDSDEAAL